MYRLVWAPLLLLCAACGTSDDDRPLELNYLTTAIFAPTCGATQCHSTFAQVKGLVFDTPEGTRQSLVGDNGLFLINFNSAQYDPSRPGDANLITWLTEIDPFGEGVGRMPFDAPMPNKDVELLIEWIGAESPGAQCDPTQNQGRACNDKEVVECNADWTFGARVQLCATSCTLGTCK